MTAPLKPPAAETADERPTMTAQEASLRAAQAGMAAAARATEHEPRLTEALLCGATGRGLSLRGLAFRPMTAGMLFTEEEAQRRVEAEQIRLGHWEAIALRAWIHHDAEAVWAMLHEQATATPALLLAAKELVKDWPIEDLQTLAAWIGAEQLRWADPTAAKRLVADLAAVTTPPAAKTATRSPATAARSAGSSASRIASCTTTASASTKPSGASRSARRGR